MRKIRILPGEPSGGDENCVEMEDDGRWNDLTCLFEHGFVCKAPYSKTPLTPASTSPAVPDTSNCGAGWEENTDTGLCYMFNSERMAYSDAKLACQEMPSNDDTNHTSNLVSITSVDEQNYVQSENFLIFSLSSILHTELRSI